VCGGDVINHLPKNVRDDVELAVTEFEEDAANSTKNGVCIDCGVRAPIGVWPPQPDALPKGGWVIVNDDTGGGPAYLVCPQCVCKQQELTGDGNQQT